MGRLSFYILDVFAEQEYAGNQLAVIRDARMLSDAEMQQIAKEMNYSETTFILSEEARNGGYDVRIFTPAAEVPFAGHPTLGTAYVIRHEIIKKPAEQVNLNLKVGQVPVVFEQGPDKKDTLWMRPPSPVFGDAFDAEEIVEILSINRQDIDDRFPIQSVATGVRFIFVPLKSLDAVRRARTVRDKLFNWVEDKEAKSIFVFCPETYNRGNHLNVRFFADYYGIAEDPATGSANGCLAAYLVKYRYFGSNRADVRVEQGYEIGRPSLLYLRAEDREGKIDVSVGGKVVMVAKGELF
jgi:trans-2,3-dihydro-3-hydroxyanthranilate isomerase